MVSKAEEFTLCDGDPGRCRRSSLCISKSLAGLANKKVQFSHPVLTYEG